MSERWVVSNDHDEGYGEPVAVFDNEADARLLASHTQGDVTKVDSFSGGEFPVPTWELWHGRMSFKRGVARNTTQVRAYEWDDYSPNPLIACPDGWRITTRTGHTFIDSWHVDEDEAIRVREAAAMVTSLCVFACGPFDDVRDVLECGMDQIMEDYRDRVVAELNRTNLLWEALRS